MAWYSRPEHGISGSFKFGRVISGNDRISSRTFSLTLKVEHSPLAYRLHLTFTATTVMDRACNHPCQEQTAHVRLDSDRPLAAPVSPATQRSEHKATGAGSLSENDAFELTYKLIDVDNLVSACMYTRISWQNMENKKKKKTRYRIIKYWRKIVKSKRSKQKVIKIFNIEWKILKSQNIGSNYG